MEHVQAIDEEADGDLLAGSVVNADLVHLAPLDVDEPQTLLDPGRAGLCGTGLAVSKRSGQYLDLKGSVAGARDPRGVLLVDECLGVLEVVLDGLVPLALCRAGPSPGRAARGRKLPARGRSSCCRGGNGSGEGCSPRRWPCRRSGTAGGRLSRQPGLRRVGVGHEVEVPLDL